MTTAESNAATMAQVFEEIADALLRITQRGSIDDESRHALALVSQAAHTMAAENLRISGELVE